MYNFFLDKTKVGEPLGIVGISFEKIRSGRLGGILRSNVGKYKGVGEVLFVEPLAVGIISAAWEKDKTDAVVTFEMTQDDGMALIDSEVNFSNFRESSEGWSVTFRDTGGIEAFEFGLDKVFEVPTNTTFALPPYSLLESKSHEINEAIGTFAYNKPSPSKSLTHTIPFKAVSTKSDVTGQPQTVGSLEGVSPVWTNTTNQTATVKVEANIVVTHRAAGGASGELVVIVRRNGNTISEIVQQEITLTGTATAEEWAVSAFAQVPSGADVAIMFLSDDSKNDFSFLYGTKSYLFVGLDKVYGYTDIFGATAAEIFAYLVSANTDNELEFEDLAGLDEYFITDGYRLRGTTAKPMLCSFGELWDDMSKLVGGLMLRLEGTKLVARKMAEYLSTAGASIRLTKVRNYDRIPSNEMLHSGLLAGFNRWQSGTPTGTKEENAVAKWNTPLKKIDNILNAECQSLTGSVRLIERLRRRRYEEAGDSSEADEVDDRQKVVIDRNFSTKINSNYTPSNIADAWAWRWSTSGNLASSYTEAGAKNPAKSANSAIFSPKAFIGEFWIEGKEWPLIGDVVELEIDGVVMRVFVDAANYLPGAAGSGSEANLSIEGRILNADEGI